MKTIELQVEGMSCGACVKRVSAALGSLAGVGEVRVDLASGKVGVAAQVDSRELLAALQQAGYPARVLGPANPAEARQTGGCGGASCCCR
ncbi:copper-binding protein [Pseudomonas sp. R-28-1W-6]|jgi:copper chaperone CopZ|uniref:heavy-metal-associated domain-containing protein n=1 Tax=Pseudomonas sp. R-28-1W-6 TaxID=2650101 RepID=UPI001365C871|nr:heavy-metal-associated domain-containing protein [Pseudomonas sp. R-28-1W-6]MWV11907.1 copper-binding protein [Pseudomonas sp. R-28-1W-6]